MTNDDTTVVSVRIYTLQDDLGYNYCEVVPVASEDVLHTAAYYGSRNEAWHAAFDWCERNGYEVGLP